MVAVPIRAPHTAGIEARARAYTRALERWLDKAGRYYARVAMREQVGKARTAVAKATDPEEERLRIELRDLLLRYGLAQNEDAMRRVMRANRRGSTRPVRIPGLGTVVRRSDRGEREGRRIVMVDLERLLAGMDAIDRARLTEGQGERVGTRDLQRQRILDGAEIEAPDVGLTVQGRATLVDGGHRLMALRDLGVRAVPVNVPEEEVREFSNRFGVTTKTPILSGTQVTRVLESKDLKLSTLDEWTGAIEERSVGMLEETRRAAIESVRRILLDAQREDPRPSVGEIARRIRTQLHGEERDRRVPAFSSERAELVARTELAQAENTGTVQGFEASGVEEIEWQAYRDGRSGDRHHERMHGKRIKLGETFETPLGNRLRYPGDPLAPIEDVIRCRCSVRARRVA